jgi:serpin B
MSFLSQEISRRAWLFGLAGMMATGPLAFAAEPDRKARRKAMPVPTEIAEGSEAFARAVYAQLATAGQGNVVVSPTSIEACVALALAGARGQTADQIAAALQMRAGQGDVGAVLDACLSMASDDAQSPLVIANSAWVQQGFPIHDAYRKLLETGGRATFESTDFEHHVEAARKAINAWVDGKTQHKIPELIPPGALDDTARLVLANAIYFKGKWARPFDVDMTIDAPFHRPGHRDVPAKLMRKDARLRYLETDAYQVVELPYTEHDLGLVVWLPKRAEALTELEREICAAPLGKSLAELDATPVELYLPRFKINEPTALADMLKNLGMKRAFEPSADFKGITDEPLWISAVVHQALVEVDEQGTEAAAATGVIAVTAAAPAERDEPKEFRADHPFVFAIRNRTTNQVLFMGRVVAPGK